MTGVAAAAAFGADVALGTAAGPALGAGAVVAVAGAAATVAKVTASHWPAAHRKAGALGQPGGPEQLRLQWLTALEVRGIRPFLDQQRMLTASSRAPKKKAATVVPQLRGGDRSAAARTRSLLGQSFGHLPAPDGPFAGRRAELAQIARWVHAARASTETKPTVVVLHGEPGSGRTTLAVRAAHELKDQFRGACVVDLRGDVTGENPLPTRDALLHLLNRLGAPREQLLFREGSSPGAAGATARRAVPPASDRTPVTVVLDDAARPGAGPHAASRSAPTAWCWSPPASRWTCPPTSRPGCTSCRWGRWTRRARRSCCGASAEEQELGPYDSQSTDTDHASCAAACRWRCASRAPRSGRVPAARWPTDLAAYGPVAPVERTLWLRYTDQSEQARRLLRRLALAGRASLGAAAAAALLSAEEQEAQRLLTVLCRAGLLDHVRGSRYRLHDLVRGFALARLLDEEEAADRTAAQERLIHNYAELAAAVIRMVDGKMSTRAGQFGSHGFTSLDAALRWLDDESSFITSALRHAEGVDQGAVLDLLGALCDYCLLRGDLYRLGEISELTQAVDQGLLERSVQWRTGIAARQLGELDKARTTLSSVVDLYREAQNEAGTALALCSLGITLHHQGNLTEAAARLREAIGLQSSDGAGRGPGVVAARAGRRRARPGRSRRGAGPPRHGADPAPGGRVAARRGVGALPAGPGLLRMGDVAGAERGAAHGAGSVRPHP